MTDPLFRHDANLARASTIPSNWYFDPELLEKEYPHVFNNTWQFVGFSNQVQKPGDFFSAKIGRENVVLCMNETKEIRAFSNVCRHRAGLIADSCGNRPNLKCRYHGWTYDLEGNLRTTPEFSGVENFDISAQKLPRFQTRSWGPLVFAAIDPKMSFESFLGRIPEELRQSRIEEMKYWKRVDYTVNANWKVYVDNYVEGYHIPMVHPTLNEELDYRAYRTETFEWYSLQHSPARPTASLYNEGTAPQAHYYWLYPNIMFNVYQGVFQLNVVIPEGPEKTTVRFEWFALDELSAARRDELLKFSDAVQEEDRRICEEVQSNLHSITYNQGRYSVKRENGLHHFHTLLTKSLSI